MSGPLVVLYGLGVGIAWIVERDRDAGSRLSWKGASVLVLLLSATVLLGGARVAQMNARHPVDDLPADASQIVGVRLASVQRLDQQAGESSRVALGPLRMAARLARKGDKNQTMWLARAADGAAAMVRTPGSTAVIKELARRHMAAEVNYAGGRAVVLQLPGTSRRIRVVAPDDETLWVGDDKAIAAVVAVRAGGRAGVGADPRLSELIEKLRSSGPLFAISTSAKGIAGWLTAGALADTVKRATAGVPKKGDRLNLYFQCRGPDAAKALRNRLDAWAADARNDEEQVDDGGVKALKLDMAKLAELLTKATVLAARSPAIQGDEAVASAWRDIGSQATNLQSRLERLPRPADLSAATSTLRKAVAAPAVLTTRDEGPEMWWTVEAQSKAVLDAFFAPSSAGIKGNPKLGIGDSKPGDKKGDKRAKGGGEAEKSGKKGADSEEQRPAEPRRGE